ncbi:hypothetical protein [Candidatus Sodalis sp. SoCistrobi]|uniref:hypothetical protein n=1 Tax=Candidatus Sodalis sp. SoCistrobi TaxID=1922216 RepID=UPI000F7926C6|nr:hypothetical protein [Candidatus Sodalis sp. SoCistrobi]
MVLQETSIPIKDKPKKLPPDMDVRGGNDESSGFLLPTHQHQESIFTTSESFSRRFLILSHHTATLAIS